METRALLFFNGEDGMNDRDVRKVEDYIAKMVPAPKTDDTRELFATHVYSQWAAYEILERVINETEKLPVHISGKETLSLLEVVDDFIDEMKYYESVSRSERAQKIFAIARTEGECLRMYICP